MKYFIRLFIPAFVFSIFCFESLAAQDRALVIGISQYTEIDSLRYADADALEFSQILTDFARYEPANISVLLNQQATKRKIVEAINKIVRDSEKAPFDNFIFMFAGHGIESTLTSKDIKGGKGALKETNIFLAPADASIDDNNFFSTGKGNEVENETFINKAWLARQLSAVKAKSIFIILDSCYSGTKSFGKLFSENEGYAVESFSATNANKGMAISQTRSLKRIKTNADDEPVIRKVAYLASSRDDQASAEYEELRHGALSYSILEYVNRARRDTSSDENRVISIDDVYSNVTKIFRETKIKGVSLDTLHQPLLVPIPDYSNVKDMVFMTVQGTNIQKAQANRLIAQEELARAKAAADEKLRLLAEAKAKQEAEAARLKAEQERARVDAERELARVKAEEDKRIKLLAEAKAKQEAEAARLKAEQDLAREKAEKLAKAKKDEEDAALKLQLLAEAKAKQEADAQRLRAEQAFARLEAEKELARLKAEAEAKVKVLAEAKAKEEVEAARLKAEQIAKEMAEQALAKIEAEARERLMAEHIKLAKAEFRVGELTIMTEPVGLDVYVDGAKRNEKSNTKLTLSEGRHVIQLYMPETGYRVSFVHNIKHNQSDKKYFSMYGNLDVASFWLKDGIKSPGPELEVFIDGKAAGKSNLHLEGLLAGTHLVEVKYKDVAKSRHIEIRPDSPLKMNYSIIREPGLDTDKKRINNVVF